MVRECANAGYPLELSIWLSPAFPVGGFAYSHGLEWAVHTGRIHGRASAEAWLGDLLEHGGPRNDAIVLSASWSATGQCDWTGLSEVNELALALASSRERRLETATQGNAFMGMVLAAWRNDCLAKARGAVPGDLAYPVAVGISSAAHCLPIQPTMQAYIAGFISNMTSALVRMSAIGQTDAQHVIASLKGQIVNLAEFAAGSSLDDLGSAALVSDIAAMAHETLETRMFRS